jgi:uncharacterized protein (DUF1697 family)
MRYVALFRGINVGNSKRISKQTLKDIFERSGLEDVYVYINSGNVLFSTKENKDTVTKKIENEVKKEIGVQVPVIIIKQQEIKRIVSIVPNKWCNDDEQRTDVAFLFPEIDKMSIIEKLPIDRDYAEVVYTKGAVIWNIDRTNINKSRLNKIIGHSTYHLMTIRNINTTRYLAEYK